MAEYRIEKTSIKGKALCTLGDRLLVYLKGELVIVSLLNMKIIKRYSVPITLWKKLVSNNRLCERVLHVEPRWAMPVNENEVMISLINGIFVFNTVSGQYKSENVGVKGKPLNIARINNVDGFDNCYAIGDYSLNQNREKVGIYIKSGNDSQWREVFSFAPGEVRHIHNIIPDPYYGRVLILTGDEDKESGIWEATDNFKNVRPIIIGNQQYRACQAFPLKDNLYYATDAPSENNYVYKLIQGERTPKIVSDLRGSCIYGRIKNGILVFSTTCEPEAHAKNTIDYWMTNKPGAGMKDTSIDVCALNENGELLILSSYVSDKKPLRLFQYASASFSNELYETDRLFFTPVCVRKDDMHIFEVVGM